MKKFLVFILAIVIAIAPVTSKASDKQPVVERQTVEVLVEQFNAADYPGAEIIMVKKKGLFWYFVLVITVGVIMLSKSPAPTDS